MVRGGSTFGECAEDLEGVEVLGGEELVVELDELEVECPIVLLDQGNDPPHILYTVKMTNLRSAS